VESCPLRDFRIRLTMPSDKPTTEFAPRDLTDNREPFDWGSKYPQEARVQIRWEAVYVAGMLLLIPTLLFVVWMGWPNLLLNLADERYATLALYGYAWLGGSLGGTLFDLKWLYHSVGKGLWHVERRLWRILIPHISGGHAFAVIVLISSGIFRIFDSTTLSRPPVVVGIGFLVGYFSDSAIGKLNEIANTLFGSSGKRYPDDDSTSKKPRAGGNPSQG
jgi:hypothetical protein